MGSWDYSCAVSGLTIRPGDKVVLMIMASNRKSGYYESSIGFGAGSNILPVMVPIRGTYEDYGDFEVDDDVDYGLMKASDLMKLIASRVVHKGSNGERVRSFDLNDFNPSAFISGLSTDEHDYHMESHALYWYMARPKEGSYTEFESLDKKLYLYPIRLVAVLESVWDAMLAENCHFWRGSFNHSFIEAAIRKFMSAERSPTHHTRIMTGPGLSYNSLWDNYTGRTSLEEIVLETHLMNRHGEGDIAYRLYAEQSELDIEEMPNLNRNQDFVRELLKKRKFSEGGWFEPTDNDALTRYFLAWSEYIHVNYVMSQLRRVWTTVCGAGSQHNNAISVANFNNVLAKIASSRAMRSIIDRIDYGDEDRDDAGLNDAADSLIEMLSDEAPETKVLEDPVDRTVVYEVVQRIELKAENVHKYSNGTRETLLELRKMGVDLTAVRNIICEKD